ncbi:MAG: protein phosphatase 2C domain-containing protein [Rothia sp. (in: high G+C Gram-positive bacteria)]|nr:protein phosphatase 2C domain-containing protein [Rothia sp. (in: high G+C Gram-positive bacteria)]
MGIAFQFAARSDVGRVRSKNDDSGYAGHYLAVVADGMGGHAGGDVASATTVLDLTPLDHSGFNGSAGVYLADEITTANIIMNELVELNPRLVGMGTTCTALLIDGNKIELAHIGDSRAYRLRDDTFEQITTDHTFVQRLLQEGRITPEEAANHPHKNVVMRVLGDVDASPELQLLTLDAEIGEKWVLSSDGLDTVVSLEEIEAIMRSTHDLNEITEMLVNLTLERGAPDNVTVATLAVIDEDSLSHAVTSPQPIIPVKQYSPNGELVGKVVPAPALKEDGEADVEFRPAEELADEEKKSSWRRHLPHEAKLRTALRHGKWRGESFSDGVFNMMTETSGVDERPSDEDESSASVLRKELDERPHLLVGAAASATNTGMIPAVTSRTLERRATLVSTEHPAPVEDFADLPPALQAVLRADEKPKHRSNWPLRLFAALLVLGVLVTSVMTFFSWVSNQYYVGVNNNHVAVFNGIPQSIGPIHFYEVVNETDVSVNNLPEYSHSLVNNTISAEDHADADRIVDDLQNQAKLQSLQPSPSASPTATPSRGSVVTVTPSANTSEASRG